MSGKQSPQSIIDSYKKRQKMTPFLIWGLAVLLVAIGLIILIVWLIGPNRPSISLFATATPTATNTSTPTPVPPTSTPTLTPTITETPTVTPTLTPSGPFEYTVQEGDNCFDLAVKYEVDLLVLLAINNFPSDQCPIKVGDVILIPVAGQALPTPTPLPTNIPRGTKIEYIVQSGDSLDGIASRFNSTVEAIMKENKLTDQNKINVGTKLVIPVNIVTPTPTRAPTSTKPANAGTSVATTAAPTVTPTK